MGLSADVPKNMIWEALFLSICGLQELFSGLQTIPFSVFIYNERLRIAKHSSQQESGTQSSLCESAVSPFFRPQCCLAFLQTSMLSRLSSDLNVVSPFSMDGTFEQINDPGIHDPSGPWAVAVGGLASFVPKLLAWFLLLQVSCQKDRQNFVLAP